MSMTCENWLRRPPLSLMPLRPVDDHAVAGAAEVGGHLLGPREGRVEGDRPAGGHVREGFRTAPLVDQRDQVLDLLGHAVEVGHLVVHADEAALGAGAVVAGDVDEQRVVHLADVFERLREPANFRVGLLQESREHFGLAREQAPLIGRQRVPGGEVLRPITELACSPGRCPASSGARAFHTRTWSQPLSNWPLYLSAHSFGTWCGAWTAPVA